MSQELTSWDIEYLERLMIGNKNAGSIVETKNGVIGRTYSSESLINGKVRVYCDNGNKLLCNPASLTLKGYID